MYRDRILAFSGAISTSIALSSMIDVKDGEADGCCFRVIEKHKRIMEDRQWELPFKVRGRNVKIRSQLERVSKSLHVFKDLGSAAAQLDPTHAGIPWAGAMFIVQGALNDSEQNEAALDGLAQIAPIVAQYAEIESIYINTSSTTFTKSFEDCLVDLYVSILKYQVAAGHHCKRSTFVRFLRAVPKLDGWADMVRLSDPNLSCSHALKIIDFNFTLASKDQR